MIDVTINGISLYNEYGLILTKLEEPLPTPRFYTVEVSGRSGYLDLTDEPITYNSRDIKLQFATKDTSEETRQSLARLIGKPSNIYIDGHYGYYDGRITSVDYEHNGHSISMVTITQQAQPYQYAKDETSLTYQLAEEEKEITIENDDMPTEPKIGVSDKATIIIEEGAKRTEYTLNKGISYPFVLKGGNHKLKIKGSGTLEITYRKGRL